MKELPETVEIKSTNEIKIGDTLCLIKKRPSFLDAYGDDGIGTLWEMKTKEDIMHASIAIIEQGQMWMPVKK